MLIIITSPLKSQTTQMVRIGTLVSPHRVPSPPRRLPLADTGSDDERTHLARIKAVVLQQW